MIYTLDTDGRFLLANHNLEKLFGVSSSQLIGQTRNTALPQEVADQHRNNDLEVVMSGQAKLFEETTEQADGTHTYLTNKFPLFDSNNNVYAVCGISTDITERKQTEEALSTLTERLDLATHSAQMGIWDWDIQKNQLIWDDQMFMLYGVNKEEFREAYETWLYGIHPDDRDRSNEVSQKAVNGEGEYDTEFRVVWPDGSVHWLKADGQVFRDETGQAIRMVGLNYDITEQKQTEKMLRQSEQKFSSLFEMSSFATSLSRLPDGVLVDVNKAFEQAFGYTKQEAIGRTSIELGINPDAKGRARILAALKEDGSARNQELALHTKSNEERIFSVNMDLMDIGDQKYILNTTQDITERKQAEEKLHLSQELFSNVFHISPAGITITRIADGKIIDANEAFLDMFEFSREEANGHTSTELNMWTSEERKKLIQAQIASGGLQNFELLARSKSGRLINLLFSSKPMEIGGEACHVTMLIDITERKQAEAELRLSRNRLADLSRKLVETHETTQRAIGRELHDQIGQMLTALKLTMDIMPQLPPELAAKKMAQSGELVNDLLSRVSALSLELRPPMLDDLGIIPALTWHVNRFQDQTGIEVEFKHSGVEGARFSSEIETTAYRAVQEALTNVARHAEATRTQLEVRAANGMLNIQIEDNGKGFNPHVEMSKHRSSGLSGMRERAILVGGTFQIESQPGKGTKKIIQLPLPEETP